MAAAADVLRASASRLEGGNAEVDLARLDSARDAVVHALGRRLPELPDDAPLDDVTLRALAPSFRIRAATYSARQVAGYALVATGGEGPELDHRDIAQSQQVRTALEATEQVAVEQGVVVEGAFGLVREHGGGHARQAMQRRAGGAACVRLPGSEQGIAAAQVEFGVGGAAHGSPDLALLTM